MPEWASALLMLGLAGSAAAFYRAFTMESWVRSRIANAIDEINSNCNVTITSAGAEFEAQLVRANAHFQSAIEEMDRVATRMKNVENAKTAGRPKKNANVEPEEEQLPFATKRQYLTYLERGGKSNPAVDAAITQGLIK